MHKDGTSKCSLCIHFVPVLDVKHCTHFGSGWWGKIMVSRLPRLTVWWCFKLREPISSDDMWSCLHKCAKSRGLKNFRHLCLWLVQYHIYLMSWSCVMISRFNGIIMEEKLRIKLLHCLVCLINHSFLQFMYTSCLTSILLHDVQLHKINVYM